MRIRDQLRAIASARGSRDIPRRVSGYNLDELLPENGFNVARALVGTEGTCAIVLEAKVKLIQSPQHRSLVGLGYADAFAAADHVPEILQFKPIGLEGFEGAMVDGLREKGAPNLDLFPTAAAILLVEFGSDDRRRRRATARAARRERLKDSPTAAAYAALHAHRSAGACGGSASRDRAPRRQRPGAPPEWEGWDDAAVAPEKLGAYLRDLRALLDEYHYQAGVLRALRPRLHPHAGQLRPADASRAFASTASSSTRAADLVVELRRLAFRRARRRPVARRAAAEDVRRRTDAALSRVQGDLGSGQQAQPAQGRRRYLPTENLRLGRRLRTDAAADALRISRRWRIDRAGRRCAASVWASAASTIRDRCARATW